MRDEQVRRYARHILLPEIGGLGQTALMVSAARLELRESEPEAELIAATFLAAGGVGTVVIRGASAAQLARLVAHGPDTRFATGDDGKELKDLKELTLQPRPPWWPHVEGDATALALWRGGAAATRWMAEVATR